MMANGALVPMCEGDLTVIWFQVPVNAIPWDDITKTVGKSNNTPFGTPSPLNPYIFPTESLVCLMPKIAPYYRMAGPDTNSNWATNITYRFKYLPNGANHWYKWNTGLWTGATR